jgi:hypothetical protein
LITVCLSQKGNKSPARADQLLAGLFVVFFEILLVILPTLNLLNKKIKNTCIIALNGVYCIQMITVVWHRRTTTKTLQGPAKYLQGFLSPFGEIRLAIFTGSNL